MPCAFLSTPPSRVATPYFVTFGGKIHVSIHATLAGGDAVLSWGCDHADVSIHATLAGGDARPDYQMQETMEFLSTPPSRVATPLWPGRRLSPCVSIHATLAGGDEKRLHLAELSLRFLSTPPSRVATTGSEQGANAATRFYPRHPRGWRHCAKDRHGVCGCVSIHATLAGGDWKTFCSVRHEEGFYPRHPRGWRLS